jgi:hypothetical protein
VCARRGREVRNRLLRRSVFFLLAFVGLLEGVEEDDEHE